MKSKMKSKKGFENSIAFLMALILTFSMIPLGVFAATTPPPTLTYANSANASTNGVIKKIKSEAEWGANPTYSYYASWDIPTLSQTSPNLSGYTSKIKNVFLIDKSGNTIEILSKRDKYDDFKNGTNQFTGWVCDNISGGNLALKIGSKIQIGTDVLDKDIKIVAEGYDDLIIKGGYPSPTLTADTTNFTMEYGKSLENNIVLSFTANKDWQNKITDISIDGTSALGKYAIADGTITLDKSLFTTEKDYNIVVKASGGYYDSCVTQTIRDTKLKIIEGGKDIYSPIVFEYSDSDWANNITSINLNGTVPKGTTEDKTSNTYYINKDKKQIIIGSRAINVSNDIKLNITSKGFKDSVIDLGSLNKLDPSAFDKDTTNHYLGDKLELKLGYGINHYEVLKYANTILGGTSGIYYCPKINVSDDNKDTITVTFDCSNVFTTGNPDFNVYAEGYDKNCVKITFKEKGPSPTIKLSKDIFYSGEEVSFTYPNEEQQYFSDWYNSLTKVKVTTGSLTSGPDLDLDLKNQISFNPDAKSITIPAEIFSSYLAIGLNTDPNISIDFCSKGYNYKNITVTLHNTRPSTLVYPMENAEIGEGKKVVLTFADNENWRNAITSILINKLGKDSDGNETQTTVANDKIKYIKSSGKIEIDSSAFENNNSYKITITAKGYADVSLTQGFGTGTSKDSFDDSKFSNDEQTKTYLQVEYGDKTYNFTKADLYKLAAAEGNKSYTYSTYNTWPTYSIKTNVMGPTIKGILEKAGVDIDKLDNNQTIRTVSGGDGMTNSFTLQSIFRTTRYYFPKGSDPKLYETFSIFRGGAHDSSYWADKQEVPAVINLDYDGGTLMFGQIYPNEQTNFAFDKYMVTAEGSTTSAPGKIIIGSKDKEATKMETPTLQNGSPTSGSTGVEGKTLDFGECGYGKMLVYTVSTDGTEPKDPTYLDTIYDYASFRNLYNKYTLTNTPTIVKFRYVSTVRTANTNELLDSDVITLYYNGASTKSQQSNKIEIGDGSITATSNYNYSDVFTADEMSQIYSDKAAGKDTAASTSLKIKAITAPSETDVANAKKALNDRLKSGQSGAVLMYFDIDLFKTLDGKTNTQVTDLNGKEITITLDIPQEYLKDGRYFYLVQIHDGKTTILEDLDNNPNTITVKIGKFSTYALAYSVGKLEEPTATTNITGDSTPKASATTTKSSLKAKTGDNTMIISSVVLVLGTSAALGFIEQRRRKENNN